MDKKEYQVNVKKKALKNLGKLDSNVQQRFLRLAQYLRENGPIAKTWQNFSDLGKGKYHCHLTYHYIACWAHEKGTIIIEVYYVGSRENAPY